MKRRSKLIGLCAVLVVLAGSYAAVSTLTAEPEEEEETGIALATLDSTCVTSLGWTSESDGELSLAREEDDTWSYTDDEDFPLDQSVPETMLEALSDVTASQVFDAAEDLADYGLDDPVLTITAALEDGTEYTFALGDQNELTLEYYLLFNGDESKVYLVDSTLYDTFSLGLYDILEMESLPDFGTATALTVTQPGGALALSYVEDSSALTYNSNYHWFLEQNGTQLALDGSKVTTLVSSVTSLSWQSCVNYKASAAQQEEYGLGDSAAVITLTYQTDDTEDGGTETFTLYIGSDTDSGTYAKLEGSDMVYLISTDTANGLRYAAYSTLRPDAICEMDWDTVDQLDVTVEGGTYTISFDTATEEVEDSDGNTTTEEVPLYTCDGVELDSDSVQSLLDAIDGLTATGDAAATDLSQSMVSFTFYRSTDSFQEVTLTLYAADTSSCLAVLDGGSGRLVDRASVTALTDLISALFSAE